MKPYKRIIRQYGEDSYGFIEVLDSRYCADRIQLLHAYRIIEKDFQSIFEYIEPCEQNCLTFSHRLYELLLRACTEVETNFTGILKDNGYNRSGNWNMKKDYFKVKKASKLDEYVVKFHRWPGAQLLLSPFRNWSYDGDNEIPLEWYQAYNKAKHNRSELFYHANFSNVLNAVAGLFVLLTSQFASQVFYSNQVNTTMIRMDNFYFDSDSLFSIKFPDSWDRSEWYDNWDRTELEPFQNYNFNI